MPFTIEVKSPGSPKWVREGAAFHMRENAVTAFEYLLKTRAAPYEVRLLVNGKVEISVAHGTCGNPQPQNLPKTAALRPSDAPIWTCPEERRRQHTADCGLFLWRNFGPWSGKHPVQLADFLRWATAGRLRTDAEDLQLMLASGTADKLQSVLVGYVSR